MPKSSVQLHRFGGSGRGGARFGNVPIIEIAERRHNVRIAKITFWVVAIVGWPTIAVLAYGVLGRSPTHPVLAGFIGLFTALALAVVTSLVVLVWPVLRVLWHWAAEISLAGLLLYVYLALVHVMVYWLALAAVMAAVGGLLVLPFTRTALLPLIWCAISRHRLRLCFAAFIASNRYGSVPFILLARPTPAGERVWIWLRPGLSMKDLEDRRDKLAVACWAKDIRLAPASKRYSALVQVDITRRNPLAADITSPLPDLVPAVTATTTTDVVPASALDLADVPEELFINPDRADKPADVKPARRNTPRLINPDEPAGKPVQADDITEWI